MPSRLFLLLVTFISLALGGTPVLAQLDVSGEANLRALLETWSAEIDAGEELTPEKQAEFEQMQSFLEDSGLERVRFVVTGEIEAPEVAVGLVGDPEKLKAALEAALDDPDHDFAELLQRDPEGGPNDFILKIPDEAEEAEDATEGSELPESVEITMTEGDDMLYFAQRGKDGQAILESNATVSILPGSHDRMWKLQSAVPDDVKASIMSAIQEVMAAGQASGNPQMGQAMMMMGMAMPIIDDVSLALAGIDTMAFGFIIAPDGRQVLDFAQRRRDPGTAATLQTGLADGSYQPEGIAGVLHAMTSAPGVETKYLHQDDVLFSRMTWSPEANEGIGQALMGSGMLYFQQVMGGAGGPGAEIQLPGE